MLGRENTHPKLNLQDWWHQHQLIYNLEHGAWWFGILVERLHGGNES